MTESNNPRQESSAFEEAPFLSGKYDEDTNLKQILARHETILSSFQSQRETNASRQLELLQAIRDELASQATPLQFISNTIIQIIFVATAFVFGLFTIYGVVFQLQAIFLAQQQNQISMVAFCQTINSVGNPVSQRSHILIFVLDCVRQTL
jgi:hypothetical protein